VERWYASTINLERPRPGAPAADATLAKWQQSTLGLLGYVINVERRRIPPSLDVLLDGGLLARFTAFLLETRCACGARAGPASRV
jgi:hypothetical protein